MAHFAELDENNVVLRVVVVDDLYEHDGHNYLAHTCGLGGTWIKTSYNTNSGQHTLGGVPFRKNFAAAGYLYDADRDAFIPPKPYDSWVLDEDRCVWVAPVEIPDQSKLYRWNEASLEWEEIAAL